MRKVITVVLLIGIMASVSACGNETDLHVQSESSNEQIVSTEVVEDPCKNGHTWVEATCELPKTCSVCGKAEGNPLGHDWSFATLEKPMTCEKCGTTVGDPIKCREIDLSFINPDEWFVISPHKDVILCGIMQEKVKGCPINITLYNYDGSIRKVINSEPSKEHGAGYGYLLDRFWIRVDDNITFYDLNGNEQKSYELDVSNGAKTSVKRCNDDRYIKIELTGSGNKTYYLDKDTMDLLDGEGLDYSTYYDYAFDEEKYSYCLRNSQMADRYLVEKKDDSKWGYLGEQLYELAMYKDASDFNSFGYAFVTEDGNSYDIIDSDFNVIAKDYIRGISAALMDAYNSDCPVLYVDTESGRKYFYIEYSDPDVEMLSDKEPVAES